MTDRPLPDVDDPLSAPFWKAAAERRLVVQACGDCDVPRHPPTPMCPECWSTRTSWRTVGTNGTVWSFVVAHGPVLPAFSAETPFVVVAVAPDACPSLRLIGRAVGAEVGDIGIGTPVTARFTDVPGGVTLVDWTVNVVTS